MGGAGEAGDGAGEARSMLRPVVELNARFTMGLVAIGLVRRALDVVRGPLGLTPGVRRAFVFALEAPSLRGGWSSAAERVGEGSLLVPLSGNGQDGATLGGGPALLFAPAAEQLDAACEAL